MARPTVPENKRRSCFVHVRLTKAEMNRAADRARARGVSLSDLMRNMLADDERAGARKKRRARIKCTSSSK